MSTITRTAASRSATTVAPVTSATAATTAGSASSPRSPTHILIDGRWYDLTHWKTSHPGGALILEQIDGQDATGELECADCIYMTAAATAATAVPHVACMDYPLILYFSFYSLSHVYRCVLFSSQCRGDRSFEAFAI